VHGIISFAWTRPRVPFWVILHAARQIRALNHSIPNAAARWRDPMPNMSVDIDVSDTPDTEVQSWLQKLGSGLTTGAADDDPKQHCDVFASGRAVRFQQAVDHRHYLPIDVVIQVISARLDRSAGMVSLQTSGVIIRLAAVRFRRLASRGQHHQHRGGSHRMGAQSNLVICGPTRVYTIGLGLSPSYCRCLYPTAATSTY
jgi:hypothetical protein